MAGDAQSHLARLKIVHGGRRYLSNVVRNGLAA
jgi:hypothetical protein